MFLPLSDTSLQLLPELAAFDTSGQTLFVADLHLGKAAAFRDAGLPLPDGSDAETLHALSALIRDLKARRLVILGDVFHARISHREALHALLRDWLGSHRDLKLAIVPGNHDRKIRWDEWFPEADILTPGTAVGNCLLHHQPPETTPKTGIALCGHLHPGISLSRRGVRGVTAPCFRLQENVLTLPAFGSFTGLSVLARVAGDRFFVSVRKQVVEVPVPH
ncbi:MAG TPA: ligase-associated DNA damage response endonuclease PdeM [Verrucomicrobiales bacterium]|nr:ligase-associated DNA damage response endonuclease PdeM [Verrucomicrobiales bacterium]